MNPVIARLRQTHCVPVNTHHSSHSNSVRDLVVTPELTEQLGRIAERAGVIHAASQFTDGTSLKTDKLGQRGCHVLDTLEKYLSNNVMKQCTTSESHMRLDLGSELLGKYAQELEPVYQKAKDQIAATTDRLNVTDRLQGYRNNMNRCGPTKPSQSWPFKIPRDHIHPIAPRFNLSDDVDPVAKDEPKEAIKLRDSWPKTCQERAGIVIQYPGISETRERFRAHPQACSEVLNNHGNLRPCRPGYRINATTDARLPGWNHKRTTHLESDNKSEYAQSFCWPNAQLINPAPWNRCDMMN